jgi:hypothetical protein
MLEYVLAVSLMPPMTAPAGATARTAMDAATATRVVETRFSSISPPSEIDCAAKVAPCSVERQP